MTWAAVALGLFQLVFLWNIHWSARRGEPADNPWRATTLEWATASPPPPGNFAAEPHRVGAAVSLRGGAGVSAPAGLIDRADRDARAADVGDVAVHRVDRDVRRPRWSRATCCCAPGARPGRCRGGTTASRPSPTRGSGCCGWSSPRSRRAPPRATLAAGRVVVADPLSAADRRARRRRLHCPDRIGRTGAHRRRAWTGLAQCAGHVVRAQRRRRRAGAGRRGGDDRGGAGHRRIRRARAGRRGC